VKNNLLIIFSILILNGCERCRNSCSPPPDPLRFKIVNSSDTSDIYFENEPIYNLDSLNLYYIENEQRRFLELYVGKFDPVHYYLACDSIPFLSYEREIKTFYLYLYHNNVKIMHINVDYISDDCCSWYEYKEVIFDRGPAPVSDIHPTVYWFFLDVY